MRAPTLVHAAEHFCEGIKRWTCAAAPVFQPGTERIIGVVLTGVDGDGENGVRIVKEMGGRVIAQDEETSEFFGMPSAAIQTGAVDFILPLHQIAPKLISLVRG